MGKDVQEMKEKFAQEIESAKEWLYQIKERAQLSNEKLKTLSKEKQQERKAQLEQKQKELHDLIIQNQKEVAARKKALEKSIEAYLVEHSSIAARKKADDAQAYASACIAFSFSTIEEAQFAIQNAISATEQAEQLKQ